MAAEASFWSLKIKKALWNKVSAHCSLGLVVSKLSCVPALQSGNIMWRDEDKHAGKMSLPLHLRLINVQQETGERLFKNNGRNVS